MPQPTRQQVVDDAGARKRDLAMIHMAKKDLRWDEDTYRDVMSAVCSGIRSSGQLDFAGRKRFLAHLQACGWKGGSAVAPKAGRKPFTPTQRKIWSLWQQLADDKRVQDRKRPALEAYIARQTGVDKLDWLNTKQEELVIESLKRWLDRKDGPSDAA